MARQRVEDARFDFRGGLNTSFSPDVLDLREFQRSLNAYGYTEAALDKRASSQRLHDNAIIDGTTPILGCVQWPGPDGLQVVAVGDDGNLYYKDEGDADFTQVAGALSTNVAPRFWVYRDGSDYQLWIASEGLFMWDGATLQDSGDFTDAPAGATFGQIYKGRSYVAVGTKELWISALNDPTDFSDGAGGLEVDVETFDADPLVAMQKVGSSLALAKADNIARYTGVSAEEINIDTETEGISQSLGIRAAATFIPCDTLLFGLTKKGPALCSEAGVELVQSKMFKTFETDSEWAALPNAVAIYHAGRRQVWLALAPEGESENTEVYVLNVGTRTWYGPMIFPFGICSLAAFETADGRQSIMAGGYDGFIRNLDVPELTQGGDPIAKDDVLRDGTGGEEIELELVLPEFHGGRPDLEKTFRQQQTLSADLGESGVLTAAWSSELGSGEIDIASKGDGLKRYPFKWTQCRGATITRSFREQTANPCTIYGVMGSAALSRSIRN